MTAALSLPAPIVIGFYPISREDREEILRRLAEETVRVPAPVATGIGMEPALAAARTAHIAS